MPEEMKHPDVVQDTALVDQKIGELVQELAPVLQLILEKLDAVEKRVEEDIIGSLTKHWNAKQKSEKIAGLKGAHGEKFGDLISYLGGPHGASDDEFWEALHDRLGEGDMDEGSLIEALLSKMTGMRDHYMGAGAKPDAEVTVEAAGEPEAVQEALEQVPEVAPEVTEPEGEKAPEPEKEEEAPVGSAKFFEKAAKGRKSKA